MFDEINEEDRKKIPEPLDYSFINNHCKALKESAYREIFPMANGNRAGLAEINRYLKHYDVMEMESLCVLAHQYREYYATYRKKYPFVFYFRAIRFLMCIQAGMDRFEAYLDSHHDYPSIQEYVNKVDTTPKKKMQLMHSVACYANMKFIILLAQAIDAPIQISYQGYKHQMIEVLRDIAVNGTSQRERVNAANSLLQHLNPNELNNLQINIGVYKEKSFIDQAQEALKMLASKKLDDIKSGSKAEDIINVDIIEETKQKEGDENE